jgi:polyisoprenoid-binding protein YceI
MFTTASRVLPTLTLALLSMATVSAASYSASTGSVTFDYKVTFVGVRGTSSDLAAEANFSPSSLAGATGTVTVKAASLKTGNGLQEGHMRGALGAEEYPNIVYALSSVEARAGLVEGQTLVTNGAGTLTLKGKTLPLAVPLKLTLTGGKVNVATQFKFNPHDFGVDYFGGANSIALNVGFVLAPR